MYATTSDFGLYSSAIDRSYFATSHPRIARDEEKIHEKFRFDTIVQLETGQKKNIQQITSHDLLSSIKQSPQYSGLLARVDYIGSVDKITGKAELRFHLQGLEKVINYFVREEMPFFVHQYSCWSSISPEQTRRLCGLKTRQLECGDLILALSDQGKFKRKPDYTQRSPTKCLVERYINEKISSSKDHLLCNNKRLKISKE